jgi:hypothetical protein
MSTNRNQFNDWGTKLVAWTTSEAREAGNRNLTGFCRATNSTSLTQDK